jgi:rhodanese-related sulfurtransferase
MSRIRRMLFVTALAVAAMLSTPLGGPAASAGQTIGSMGRDGVPRVSQREFKRLIARKNVVIVDVRPEDRFHDGRIPGAVSLPLESEPDWPAKYDATIEKLKAANKPVVTYCGCEQEVSAARAARLLSERGVSRAFALTGGWNDWFNNGNRIAKGGR